MISAKQTSALFYLGTLISSVGSMALAIALVGFMLAGGFDLLKIGLVIGISRFVPVLISIFVGHRLDAYSPRWTLLVTEVAASFASILLFVGWNSLDKNFSFILVAMVLRSIFTSAQTGSRSQITKLLSQDDYKSNSRNAVWLNNVTQGATLFGAAIAWIAVKYSSLEVVIAFDALTFIINGLILYILPINLAPSVSNIKVSAFTKFKDLYRINGWAASLDALLVLSVMGANSFSARLAGADESWMPLFVLSYGVSVWLSGFVERGQFVQRQRHLFWILLGVTLILLGQFKEPSFAMWIVCFVKDIAFWMIFHRIASHIQHDTPKDKIASVTFARNAQVISIFALGEIAVGAWQKYLSLETECLLRAGVCVVAIVLIATVGQREQTLEKAHL